MPETILGLPLHPLIVHATVILVPGAALMVALAAVNDRFRRWAGPLPAIAAIIAAALVPLTTGTGESLEHSIGQNRLIEEHAELGESLIWIVLPLALVAVLGHFLHRRAGARRSLVAAVALAAVGLSAATLADVALIGHSGAKAAWAAPAQSGG